VLHTPGGLVLAATQIARAIRRRPGKVTAVIPHYAMSGGTLIALACHEILMSPNAVLGPVDPQVGQYPAGSLLKVVREKPIAEIDDETLILADQAEKAVAQVREVVKELLADKYPPERADELARMASEGRWTHDRPITYDEIKGLGHPVSDQLPKEFLELMTLYPQPVRATPSVEYLKRPRHRDAGGPQLSG
jgi:ClpP class serine protease